MAVRTVPVGALTSTRATTVNVSVAPLARELALKVTVPPLPGTGVTAVHPPGAVAETKVMFAGIGMETSGALASLGPSFVTMIS